MPDARASTSDSHTGRPGEASQESVPDFRASTLPMLFRTEGDPESNLNERWTRSSGREPAINDGASNLILSDRGIDDQHAPIPSLLATAAVHHHLIRDGNGLDRPDR